MSVREEQVSFESGGNVLYGTLGMPPGEPRGGVVLVHGWTGCRMGPNRILVEAARHLNACALATLRFDLSGRGESEGDPLAMDLDCMIADSCAALRTLRSRLPTAAPVALLGMCSGGNVALGALTVERHVRAAVCWSTYPFQSQRQVRHDVRRTGHFLGQYARKAFRPGTWGRLVRGRLHLRMILKVLFGHFRKRGGGSGRNLQESVRDAQIVEELGRYRGRLLFLFGGVDPEAVDARRIFERFFAAKGVQADFDEIPGANHNFYSLEWKRAAIERSADWLLGAIRNK